MYMTFTIITTFEKVVNGIVGRACVTLQVLLSSNTLKSLNLYKISHKNIDAVSCLYISV